MRETLKKAAELLYPPRCPVCFEIVKEKNARICPACRKKLSVIEEPVCKCCGKPLEEEEAEFCYDCVRHPKHFKKGIGLYRYESVSKALFALKYKDKKEFADFFAEELAKVYGKTIVSWNPDALIPIPLYFTRRLGRGYNQAELLADKLGELLALPVRTDILKRTRYTRPQKTLSDSERKKNLSAAFKARQADLHTVVLIDDIYTTGSTMEACTKVLLAAGVAEVYVVTAAMGQGC